MNANPIFLIKDYSEMTTTEAQQTYIEAVEDFINQCREAANAGEELVSDAVYDTAIDILRQIKPDSPIFNTTWSQDADTPVDENIDKYLITNPMLSILTIKDVKVKEIQPFANAVLANKDPSLGIQLHASMKMNGHGIRYVYNNGDFVKAHTRGRASNGRDITRALSLILPPHIAALEGKGIVEFRGELLLPYSNMQAARGYKPDIKSAFTGVSALIRESASDEEYKLLKVVSYACYNDSLQFKSLTQMYQFIQSCGLETPIHKAYMFNGTDVAAACTQVVNEFEQLQSGYDYFTDGVVLSIDDLGLLNSLGTDKTTRIGNVALKIGFWKQDMYSTIVDHIEWNEGRTKLTPVAVCQPTLTANGSSVTNVPLYAPIHILALEAYPGNTIHFRYGGEAGVVPCYPDGRLVTDIS